MDAAPAPAVPPDDETGAPAVPDVDAPDEQQDAPGFKMTAWRRRPTPPNVEAVEIDTAEQVQMKAIAKHFGGTLYGHAGFAEGIDFPDVPGTPARDGDFLVRFKEGLSVLKGRHFRTLFEPCIEDTPSGDGTP